MIQKFRGAPLLFLLIILSLMLNMTFSTRAEKDSTPTALSRKEDKLYILYTASLSGNLIGCNCKHPTRPGLPKSAYFIRDFRNRHDHVMLVDAGDILISHYTPDSLAKYILKAYQCLQYDVITLGENEFSIGAERVLDYRKSLPLQADNCFYKFNGRDVPLNTAPKIIQKGGVRVGILATLEPATDIFNHYPKEVKEQFKLKAIETIVPKNIKMLQRRKVDLKLWIYHGSLKNARLSAKKIQGIDVMIVAHEGRVVAEKVGGTMLVSPGELGNRIGVLEFSMAKKRIFNTENRFEEFDYAEDPDDPEVFEMINDYLKMLNTNLQGLP
jgi:2',3'-cyclic-nucleotide 2'-phosphodiesterase/3'-nucleotidase